MRIRSIACDICSGRFSYEYGLKRHKHSELDIGGVPMNIWSPLYSLPKGDLQVSIDAGVRKFKRYIPFEIKKEAVDNEGSTPLIKMKDYMFELYLKDESKNPTGSFKDRGMPLLVSDVINKGKKKVAIPSTGNAAISLVHYAGKLGLGTVLFVPEKSKAIIPRDNHVECIECKDLIEAYERFFSFCNNNEEVYNGFPVTNIPYSQGLKTISYELYIDLNNKVPDWVVVPCGSGGNIVSQYQGYLDLYEMGLTKKIPRFVSVQIEGADPITQGLKDNRLDKVVVLDNIKESKADAIASDTCFNYLKIMRILRNTGGLAVSVTDEEIAESDDYGLEFSSNSVFPAFRKISKMVKDGEKVVLIGTAGGKR